MATASVQDLQKVVEILPFTESKVWVITCLVVFSLALCFLLVTSCVSYLRSMSVRCNPFHFCGLVTLSNPITSSTHVGRLYGSLFVSGLTHLVSLFLENGKFFI